MEAIYNKSKNCLIVRLKGELDDHAAIMLRKGLKDLLKKYPDSSLLLNMQELRFMDSSGVGVILGRYKEINQKNRKLMLCALNPQIKRILDLAGILTIIQVFKTERDALSQGRFEE